MDFKVEGLWNTEKYCRPSWLASKKVLDTLERLKQYHLNFGGGLLTVSTLKLYLFSFGSIFYFCYAKKGEGGMVHMPFLQCRRTCVVHIAICK